MAKFSPQKAQSRAEEASRYVEEGWGDPEPSGRWTIAERASLSVDASSLPPGQDAVVTLTGNAYDPPGQEPAQILLQANDRTVAEWHVVPGPDVPLVAHVPAADIGPSGILHLTLVIPHPRSPARYGQSADPRALGFFVDTIEITASGGSS